MTWADYAANLPGADDVATVKAALARAGHSIAGVAADGGSIDVRRDAATVARAFGAPIHNFEAGGRIFAAATAKPALAGAPGALVAAITGLGTARTRNFGLRQIDRSTNRPVAIAVSPSATKTAAGSTLNSDRTDACYPGKTIQQMIANEGEINLIGKRAVTGYFAAGTGYGVCGYDATQLRAHYRLTSTIGNGIDGTGQTIGIVVAYGSPFILSDVNYGLDTSLSTASGWDNMTGYGEPNGYNFVASLAKAAKGGQ